MCLDIIELNKIIYDQFKGFLSLQYGVSLDERVVKGFHTIFFNLKSKLFPIHLDMI